MLELEVISYEDSGSKGATFLHGLIGMDLGCLEQWRGLHSAVVEPIGAQVEEHD